MNASNSKSDKLKITFEVEGYALPDSPLLPDQQLESLNEIFNFILRQEMDPDMPHVRIPELFQHLANPKILNLVEKIIGEDVLLWASHFISKEPFTGLKTPWHTDGDYWRSKIANLGKVKICTIWLALDDVDLRNGCMGVIPGTHKLDSRQFNYVNAGKHSLFEEEIKDVDESKAVWLELKKGMCSLHDPRIIHGAKSNRSHRRRCGYTMRYISGNVEMLDKQHPLYLLRGKSRSNFTDANLQK